MHHAEKLCHPTWDRPMATKKKQMAKPRQKKAPVNQDDHVQKVESQKNRTIRKRQRRTRSPGEHRQRKSERRRRSQTIGAALPPRRRARRPVRPTIGPDSGRPWFPNRRPARSRMNSTSPFRFERIASNAAAGSPTARKGGPTPGSPAGSNGPTSCADQLIVLTLLPLRVQIRTRVSSGPDILLRTVPRRPARRGIVHDVRSSRV